MTALHEGGHFVAGLVLGLNPDHAIILDGPDEHGRYGYTTFLDAEVSIERDPVGWGAMLIAGPLASRIWLHEQGIHIPREALGEDHDRREYETMPEPPRFRTATARAIEVLDHARQQIENVAAYLEQHGHMRAAVAHSGVG